MLEEAIRLATDLHWNDELVKAAARAAGLSGADAMLLLPKGPSDLAALLFRRHDKAALAELADLDVAAMKVRERIRTAVATRVEAAMEDEAAVRRAAAYLTRPSHAPLALSLGWATADVLWRWAGDTSTDENHYSKRAILGAVLASTVAVRLASGAGPAAAHLQSSIDRVMAFEKWKGGLHTPADLAPSLARMLGRLRYG